MKIREIILEAEAAEQPAPEEVKAVQELLGTIDVKQEQPQSLLNKLTGWMREHPLMDKITDLIPQTRLVKAISAAVDSLEAGNSRQALADLASGLTGNVGKAVAQANTLVNVGTNLAQGDVKAAALSAGGNLAKVAKGAGAAQSLAQGDVAGAVGNVSKGAGTVATALQNKLAAPQTVQTVAQQPDELERIKQLAQV